MKRISVIGISGAGKSTLGRALASSIGGTHTELDSLFHQADWTPLPRDEFRRRVTDLVQEERWVIDGNYTSAVRELVWEAADTVVWPDLSMAKIFPRLLNRTLSRMWRGTELWNGNRERWSNLVDPRPDKNLMLWLLTQHGYKRRRDLSQLGQERWAHLKVIRLRTPNEVTAFTERLSKSGIESEAADLPTRTES